MITDPTVDTVSFHIRWMIRRDMPEMIEIEQTEVGPIWEEEDFLRTLRQRNCIGMVAEIGDKIAGFIIYELHKNYLEIVKIGASPQYYKSAITQMLDKLKSKLSSHRRTRLAITVPLKNLPLLKLLRKENFKAVANYDDYYEDFDSDAIKLRYKLS